MKTSIVLLLVVMLSLLFHSYLPISAKSFLYAISLSVKEGLLFTIPFIIFFFLLNSIISLQSNAIRLLSLMVIMICVSNFMSTWTAYAIHNLSNVNSLHDNMNIYKTINSDAALEPSWQFNLPHTINNRTSMIAALLAGVIILLFIPTFCKKISVILLQIIDFILYKILIPIIPVFVAGFIIKFAHDEILSPIITNYFFIFLIIVSSSVSYIMIWHFVILRFFGTFSHLKNMLPALTTGFSTMSSVVSLPLLVMAAEKNVKDKKILHAVIAPITNFHLVGDCFVIPILALTITTTVGNPPLDMYQYFIFSIYFVVSKFAVAAVPGGGILVMLPVLKSTMGFDDTMLSLITTLYIMFDCIITPMNIFGNGVFSIFLSKMYNRLFLSRKSQSALNNS